MDRESAPERTLLEELEDALRNMPPEPEVQVRRVVVTHLVPPHAESALLLRERRWLLIHPTDWRRFEDRFGTEVPETTTDVRAFGIPVERVGRGSEREDEVREAMIEALDRCIRESGLTLASGILHGCADLPGEEYEPPDFWAYRWRGPGWRT